MRFLGGVAALVLLSFTPGGRTFGQVTMEFGADAAYERVTVVSDNIDTPALSLFALPMQSVRAGFHVQEGISLEPRLGITRISGEGGGSDLQIRASFAGLYFLGGTPRDETSFFVSILTGMDYASVSLGDDSASAVQLRVGGGGGVLAPIKDRLAFRTSVEFHRSFESDDALASNHLIIALGFSFLVH